MILRDILHAKGRAVHTIGPEATLEDVVQTLVSHNCGSLVVCDGPDGTMVGIITERDILRACSVHKGPLAELRVDDFMTRNLATGSSDDSVEETMGLMTERRIRHLPIVDDGRLKGLVSIGDIVKLQFDHLSLENHYLKNYLHG